jgi:hypothetical protein
MAKSCSKISILMLGFAVLVVGCGEVSNQLASLTVSPTTATVGVSKEKAFSVVGKNSVGNIISVTPTWTVEGGIGTVTTTGIFIAGTAEGTGSVVASAEAYSAKATVTITLKGWLEGAVIAPDSGKVQGVKVYLKTRTDLNSYSDADGKYSIANIPAGTYEAWTTETQLYSASSKEVTVASGETVTWDFYLTLKPGAPTVPTTTLPSF